MQSWRADPVAKPLADRHYTRQNPESAQFVPPASCLVLRTPDAAALWVTTWPIAKYVRHAWPGAWVCSLFRNERPDLYLSSELIREAVAATRWHYGAPPAELGMVTFVDPTKTRRKRDPGRCFVRAGFVRLDVRTKDGDLVVLQMLPDAMPEPAAPMGQMRLELPA
jgi:hypothetical protein